MVNKPIILFYHYIRDDFNLLYNRVYYISLIKEGVRKDFSITSEKTECELIKDFIKYLQSEIKNNKKLTIIGWNVGKVKYGINHILKRTCMRKNKLEQIRENISEVDFDSMIKNKYPTYKEDGILSFLGIRKFEQLMIINDVSFYQELSYEELKKALIFGEFGRVTSYCDKRAQTLFDFYSKFQNEKLGITPNFKLYVIGVSMCIFRWLKKVTSSIFSPIIEFVKSRITPFSGRS